MSVDLKFQPRMLSEMVNTFQDKLVLVIVSELESKNILFVEDGNHGEYRPLSHEFVEEGIPFVRPPDLVNGRINLKECQKINTTAFKRVRKGIGQGGDIVLTHNATIGRVAITNETDSTFVTNPQTTVWRSNNNKIINNKYLYYFMCSAGFQEQLDFHKGRNATFDYVSLTKQRSLVIPILEIEIQKKIAHILSTLDDKIELNRKMNQTLESMASVIFKSWFVDFDPVHAKANCTDEAEIENIAKKLGISKAILDLFPSEFEESELGMIPKGWEVYKIMDKLEVLLGGTPSRSNESYWTNGTVAWINSGKVNEFRIIEPSELITEEAVKKSSTKLLPKKTTVLAITGATLGQVSLLEIDSCANQSVIGLLETEELNHSFVYPCIGNAIKDLISHQTGGAQQHINKGNVENYQIVVPSSEVLEKYVSLVRPLLEQISNLCFENQALKKTRDTLLPKLLSGEIDVSDLELDISKNGV